MLYCVLCFAAQLQLQPELEGTLPSGAMLQADADALAAQHMRPARAELALNPARFESWELYAGLYNSLLSADLCL